MSDKHHSELTRQELYDLVWEIPMIHLAKRFGLSDQGLRKFCIKQQVPAPTVGYWARVEAGQKPQRPPLREFSERLSKARREEQQRESEAAKKAIAMAWQPPVVDLTQPVRWHPCLADLRRQLSNRVVELKRLKKVSEWEAKHPGHRHIDRELGRIWGAWEHFADRGEPMIETHKRAALRVSLPHYQRALRLLNAIVLRATTDGYTVAAGEHLERIEISKAPYTVTLRMAEKLEPGYRGELNTWSKKIEQKKVYSPTGRLNVWVTGGLREVGIADVPGNYLEARIEEVMVVIASRMAAEIAQRQRWEVERLEREERNRRAQELERLREIERKRKAEEEGRRAALLAEAEMWRKVRIAARYLRGLDVKVAAGGTPKADYFEWRRWAQRTIEAIDPANKRVQEATADRTGP